MAAVAALMQGNTTSNSVKNTKSGNESATLKIHKTTQRGFSVVGGKIKEGALNGNVHRNVNRKQTKISGNLFATLK